jgi:hypothetical protein
MESKKNGIFPRGWDVHFQMAGFKIFLKIGTFLNVSF